MTPDGPMHGIDGNMMELIVETSRADGVVPRGNDPSEELKGEKNRKKDRRNTRGVLYNIRTACVSSKRDMNKRRAD